MWQDTIVEEVRTVRQEHAKKFNFDLREIFADLKKQEKNSSRKFVTFTPKRALATVAVR